MIYLNSYLINLDKISWCKLIHIPNLKFAIAVDNILFEVESTNSQFMNTLEENVNFNT